MLTNALRIPLTREKTAIIDAEDLPLIVGVKWNADRCGNKFYASSGCASKKRRMHRVIAGAARGQLVDHINGDTMDNRRCNLRITTKKINAHNSAAAWGTSTMRGVSWNKRDRRWRAQISIDGKRLNIGYYSNETDASIAYEAARKQAGLV